MPIGVHHLDGAFYTQVFFGLWAGMWTPEKSARPTSEVARFQRIGDLNLNFEKMLESHDAAQSFQMPSSPVTPKKPGELSTETVYLNLYGYGMIWDDMGKESFPQTTRFTWFQSYVFHFFPYKMAIPSKKHIT